MRVPTMYVHVIHAMHSRPTSDRNQLRLRLERLFLRRDARGRSLFGDGGVKVPAWFFWAASLTMGVAGYAIAAVVAANPY